MGASLLLGAGTAAADPPVGPQLAQASKPSVAPPKGGYRIVGVGDIMMGSDYPQPIMYGPLKPGADPASIIGRDLYRILKGAHVTFGNMEGTIHTRKAPAKYCRNPRWCYVFRSPPFHADFLRKTGFNMMSMANNHAGDFLEPGRIATWNNLKRAGIAPAGLDKPGYRSSIITLKDGTRVGLIAFAPNPGTIQINKIPRAQRLVRALARRSDITIVSFHGGAEGARFTRVPKKLEVFLGEWRGDVWRFAHAVIDAGADVVFGHGPHVPRAIEVYKGRFIAYSLGNFWTYGRFNLRGLAGVAPVADLRVDKSGRLLSLRIHSVKQIGRGVPRIDPNGAALAAVRRLTALDFPNSGLSFSAGGRVTGRGIGVAAR